MRAGFSLFLFAGLLFGLGCDASDPTVEPTAAKPDSVFITFGTNAYDVGRAILESTEGDLLIAGETATGVGPTDGPLPQPGLARVMRDSVVVWNQQYGLQFGRGRLVAIRQSAPASFTALFDKYDGLGYPTGVSLFVFDDRGKRVSTLYDRSDVSTGYSLTSPLLVTPTGDFIFGIAPSYQEILLTRVNSSGNTQWETPLPGHCWISALLEAENGDILVLGTAPLADPRKGCAAVMLTRLTASGVVQWSQRYHILHDGTHTTDGVIIRPSNKGYLIAGGGLRQTPSGYTSGVLAMQVDEAGALNWHRLIPTKNTFFTHATATTDGGLVIIGGIQAFFILKIDAQATLLWHRVIAEKGMWGQAHSVVELADTRLAITGGFGPDERRGDGATSINLDTFLLILDQNGHF